MYNFFIPPQKGPQGLQKILTPSPIDQPYTAGLKITNPKKINILTKKTKSVHSYNVIKAEFS